MCKNRELISPELARELSSLQERLADFSVRQVRGLETCPCCERERMLLVLKTIACKCCLFCSYATASEFYNTAPLGRGFNH